MQSRATRLRVSDMQNRQNRLPESAEACKIKKYAEKASRAGLCLVSCGVGDSHVHCGPGWNVPRLARLLLNTE
jgi:hypothetical protein